MSTKCPKNVEKCLKNVRKLSGGAENTIFGHFLDNFCLFGRCFCLVALSNARPLQVRCFPLEPFFEINPGILYSGIDSQWRLIALNSG